MNSDDNSTDCNSGHKVNELSKDEYENVKERKNEILNMALDCMLIISSSATDSLDISAENEICKTVIEQINFLEHINKHILKNRPDYKLERYLAIIVYVVVIIIILLLIFFFNF